MTKAFYVKCRPQGADIMWLADKYHRVFIGYPPIRRGGTWNRKDVRQYLLDIAEEDSVELDPNSASGYRAQVTQNRGFATQVTPGCFVVVPRPGEGVCFLGKISGRFSLVRNPIWGDEYLARRRAEGLAVEPEEDFLSDIVQTWPVEGWKTVPFAQLPRWITYRLLSRNTIGWIEDHPEIPVTAVDILGQLYEGTFALNLNPTSRADEVETRLLHWVSPAAFEHLVCDLLQLDQPHLHWWHIGGSGDGGVDGIGMDAAGNLAAVVQCKWKYEGSLSELASSVREPLKEHWQQSDVHVYVATLFQAKYAPVGQGATVWSRREVAELLIKHRTSCAMARTLGIQ